MFKKVAVRDIANIEKLQIFIYFFLKIKPNMKILLVIKGYKSSFEYYNFSGQNLKRSGTKQK